MAVASLCPSRPSYGGKPGKSRKPWALGIQLQWGSGSAEGGVGQLLPSGREDAVITAAAT